MALRLRLLRTALPPPPLRWPGDRVRCAAEASPSPSPWTSPSSSVPWRREGRLARWRGAGRGASPSCSRAGYPLLLGSPFSQATSLSGGRRAGSSSRAAAGLFGRKTNLCRCPAARRRLPALSVRRGGAPSAPGSAGTYLPPEERVSALTLLCFKGAWEHWLPERGRGYCGFAGTATGSQQVGGVPVSPSILTHSRKRTAALPSFLIPDPGVVPWARCSCG